MTAFIWTVSVLMALSSLLNFCFTPIAEGSRGRVVFLLLVIPRAALAIWGFWILGAA